MRSERKIRAFAAVFVSFVSLFTAGGIALLFFSGDRSAKGALVSLVPYLFGFFAAFVMLKAALPCTYDPSAEEERISFGEDEEAPSVADRGSPWIYGAASLFLLLAANFIFAFLTGAEDVRTGAYLAVSAVIGVILKPLLEELLFRRAYLDVLIRRGAFPEWAGILIQAVLFGAIHRGYAALFAVFAGPVLGYLSVKHSFKLSLAVHASYNLILYVIMALSA